MQLQYKNFFLVLQLYCACADRFIRDTQVNAQEAWTIVKDEERSDPLTVRSGDDDS